MFYQNFPDDQMIRQGKFYHHKLIYASIEVGEKKVSPGNKKMCVRVYINSYKEKSCGKYCIGHIYTHWFRLGISLMIKF